MIRMLPPAQAAALERLDLRLEIPHEIPELEKLLYSTVLAGGKRFRPALCFLMGGVLGLDSREVAPYARVAELMHAATLAHDDVIDEADKRRNKPTLNAIATNQKAVLTGDLLLARVVNEIAQLGNLEILRDGAQVLEDLVRGEWLQIERRGKASVTRGMLEAAAQKKTASLIAWCCTTPARLASQLGSLRASDGEELLERCQGLGNLIGLSFQMADDILDFELEGEKPFANDLTEGLVNFVVLEMLEREPGLATELQKLLGAPANAAVGTRVFPWSDAQLDSAKAAVRSRVRSMIRQAQNELQEIARFAPLSGGDREGRDAATESLDTILALMAERMN